MEVAALGHLDDLVDRAGELALVDATGAAVEVGVTDFTVLEQRQQFALVDAEVHRNEPSAQECDRVVGPEIRSRAAVPHVALCDHALDDLQDGRRVGSGVPLARTQRPDRERHCGVGPLRGAALRAVSRHRARPDVGEELRRRGCFGGLRERAADIDSGVVIGASDGRPSMGLDVNERRQVELFGP